LTASTELEDRVRRVVAFNPYDYSEGVGRANRVASIYVGGACLPAIGPVVTRMENKPVLGIVLRGGLFDGSKLPKHYLGELRRMGRPNLGRAHSNRPEKVQRLYVEAIGGNVGLPALCDKRAPGLGGEQDEPGIALGGRVSRVVVGWPGR